MPATSLRRFSRISGALAVVLAMAAAFLTFAAPRASAMLQERMTLALDEIKEVTFPGVPGNNPANDLHTPEVCNTSPYCDTIPVTIVRPPGFDDTQDYFVQFQLSWETEKVPQPLEASGEYSANDLDMFLYNDPIDEDAGADQDGVIANGASGGEPEVAYLFAPEGNYSIVVVNFVGVNTAYTIKLTWVSETITNPFESLAPGFRPPASAPRPQVSAPDSSAGFVAPPLPAPTLDALPIETDAAFDTGFGPDDFDETLAAPIDFDVKPIKVTRPDPPSNLALVLWMLALPLAAIAFGGSYLSRRSAALLRI